MSVHELRLLEQIEEKNKQRDYLIRQYKLWLQITAQGIDIAQVKSFGFHSGLFNLANYREHKKAQETKQQTEKRMSQSHFNYVRLVDDTKVILSPILPKP